MLTGWWVCTWSSEGMVTILCNLVVKAGNVLLRKLAPLLFELMTNCCNAVLSCWALDDDAAAAVVGDIDESELILGWCCCCSKPNVKNQTKKNSCRILIFYTDVFKVLLWGKIDNMYICHALFRKKIFILDETFQRSPSKICQIRLRKPTIFHNVPFWPCLQNTFII